MMNDAIGIQMLLLLLDQENMTGVVAATAVTGSWKINLTRFIHETKRTEKERNYVCNSERKKKQECAKS